MLLRLFALTVLALPLTALAAQPAPVAPSARVTSPDGRITVDLTSDPDGRVIYSVSRDRKALLAPSHLGFLLADTPKIDRAIT